ncbi:MAG: hypothetical protein PHC68_18745 [Syntrophorhabdaceae bacterium]|jgi:hypothetical protein|nr:hypothetical protein [Syntrophorhabdaceae bacterium]
MADSNGNGFKVAFWTMTVIATIGMTALSSAMVNNDRLRASEDQRIECKVGEQYIEIIQRLTRIESKIEITKQ